MSFFVYGGNVEAEQLTCSTDFKSVGPGTVSIGTSKILPGCG